MFYWPVFLSSSIISFHSGTLLFACSLRVCSVFGGLVSLLRRSSSAQCAVVTMLWRRPQAAVSALSPWEVPGRARGRGTRGEGGGPPRPSGESHCRPPTSTGPGGAWPLSVLACRDGHLRRLLQQPRSRRAPGGLLWRPPPGTCPERPAGCGGAELQPRRLGSAGRAAVGAALAAGEGARGPKRAPRAGASPCGAPPGPQLRDALSKAPTEGRARREGRPQRLPRPQASRVIAPLEAVPRGCYCSCPRWIRKLSFREVPLPAQSHGAAERRDRDRPWGLTQTPHALVQLELVCSVLLFKGSEAWNSTFASICSYVSGCICRITSFFNFERCFPEIKGLIRMFSCQPSLLSWIKSIALPSVKIHNLFMDPWLVPYEQYIWVMYFKWSFQGFWEGVEGMMERRL